MLPLIVLAVAFAVGAARPARAEDWLVRKVTGSAFARTGQDPAVPLVAGMQLPPAASVGTTATGRVMLERSSGVVVVGPSTIIQLYDPKTGQSAIIQHKGVVDFEVEKREKPHFFVETPFAAAVVKGTGFRTEVTNRDSRVSVSHGVVNVTERGTGRTVDLTAGQSASTHGRDGLSTSGPGRAEVTTGRAPAVSPTVAQAFASTGRSVASASPAAAAQGASSAGQAADHGARESAGMSGGTAGESGRSGAESAGSSGGGSSGGGGAGGSSGGSGGSGTGGSSGGGGGGGGSGGGHDSDSGGGKGGKDGKD